MPGKDISLGTDMTRVSPPTYLSWPSEGRGRILPPWLHKNFTLLLGEPGAEHGAEPHDIVCLANKPPST